VKYKNIKALLYQNAHMIRSSKLQEICSLIEARSDEEYIDDYEAAVEQPVTQFVSAVSGQLMGPKREPKEGGNLIAVVPLFGTMMQHSLVHDASGGTSTEQLSEELRRLDSDPQIGSVVMEVHSPGGQVYGAFELAQQVRDMRTRVVTVANSEMASAALLVGTSADEVFATTGGAVGSIGVVTVHSDVSRAEEASGVKTTVIAEPPAKASGNPFEPLSEESLREMKADVRNTYVRFRDFVAANRGVTAELVESDFGSGRMLNAREAADVGLIDGIRSKHSVIERERSLLAGSRGNSNANRLKLGKMSP